MQVGNEVYFKTKDLLIFGYVIELMIARSVKEHGGTEKSDLMEQIQTYHFFNPFTTNVPHHLETSQLTCIGNQLTGSM